jgi:exosome complex component MTR3
MMNVLAGCITAAAAAIADAKIDCLDLVAGVWLL